MGVELSALLQAAHRPLLPFGNQAKGVRWAKDYVLGDKVKVPAAAG